MSLVVYWTFQLRVVDSWDRFGLLTIDFLGFLSIIFPNQSLSKDLFK